MQKPLEIQKCDGQTDRWMHQPTDLPTNQYGKVQSRMSATNKKQLCQKYDEYKFAKISPCMIYATEV